MSLAAELLPPIAYRALRSMRDAASPPVQSLFDGDGDLFKRVAATCDVYGEYGVGASTNWIYEHTSAHIVASETSAEWAHLVLEGKDPGRIDVELIDVEPIGEWGRPINYDKRENFKLYHNSIWQRRLKPDVVLIDGRFRVCCFLTSVLNGSPGLRILFDDYADRPHYHIVEEIVPIKERCGRQVLFEIDAGVDLEKAASLREKFAFVME